jgi:hypothetical protein
MENPNIYDIYNACPYCLASIPPSDNIYQFWPPWKICGNCGKRYGRSRSGTVKIGHIYFQVVSYVIVIAVFIYSFLWR